MTVWNCVGVDLNSGICERLMGVIVQIDWVLLREYSPADYADHAEGMQQGCIISQRKTVLRWWWDYCGFCGSSAIISVICGRHWGFCVHWLSTLVCEKLITSQICHMFNGRSHGNKILKLRKFRANEYRVKFTWTMLSAAEILYQKKRPNIDHWAL